MNKAVSKGNNAWQGAVTYITSFVKCKLGFLLLSHITF